jgi:hypothetical protein
MKRFPAAAPEALPVPSKPAPADDTAVALRELVAAMKASLTSATPPQVVVAPPTAKPWNTLTVSIVRDRKGDFEKLIFTKT